MKSLFCVNSRGAREIYPSLDEINKVRTKKPMGFSCRNRKFKRFFWPKTGDLKKKKSSQPQKTLIWTLICAPVAPSLLISSGHSPRLGGHNFCLEGTSSQLRGGHGPGMPPRGAGSDAKRLNKKTKKTCIRLLSVMERHL